MIETSNGLIRLICARSEQPRVILALEKPGGAKGELTEDDLEAAVDEALASYPEARSALALALIRRIPKR